MCMLESFVIDCVESGSVFELYECVYNEASLNYVLNVLHKHRDKLKVEKIVCDRKSAFGRSGRYKKTCQLNDLNTQIGRLERLIKSFETSCRKKFMKQ